MLLCKAKWKYGGWQTCGENVVQMTLLQIGSRYTYCWSSGELTSGEDPTSDVLTAAGEPIADGCAAARKLPPCELASAFECLG